MAVQKWQQTMTQKYWKRWQDRLEQAEDQSFESLANMAEKNYRVLKLRSCFQHWREKLARQRHMQNLEQQAETWFAERVLPRCFKSWVEFTLQRRQQECRRLRAEVFNREWQYSWVFYTWVGRSEKHREEMLSERMAILHEERGRMQTAWARWRQRTQQQIEEIEEEEASHRAYQHRLLQKAMVQWKEKSTEIRDGRNRELQARRLADLHRMRSAVEKWKKFVQSQKRKRSRLKEMQHYHETKLFKRSFKAWKKEHLRMSQIYDHAEELHRQQTKHFLRNVLTVWRQNAVLLSQIHIAEQQAHRHFKHSLQLKVLIAWRGATVLAVSKRHQQEEALSRIQMSRNQVRLLQTFRDWRERTREARRERRCLEMARRHHNSKLLSNTLRAWTKNHQQHQKNKVMKRQANMLLKLKLYQTYYELWKVKLQGRWREAEQTEAALWHWSLTLQAKVLCAWRFCVTEQRRRREEAATAARLYRDQLLTEGVTRILTYAAHMNDLTTSLSQSSREKSSRPLHGVVRRCAMKWKQKALGKPLRDQEAITQPPKKSVTFSLPAWSSDSGKQGTDRLLRTLLLTRRPRREPRRCEEFLQSDVLSEESLQHGTGTEAAPKPSDFTGLSESDHPAARPYHPTTSTHQSTNVSTLSPSEPHMCILDSPQEDQNQDLLLPPSAFMTTGLHKASGGLSVPGAGDAPIMSSDQFGSSFKHCSSTHPDAAVDSSSTLTKELLRIQIDMKNYQQGRKQLRAWQKLREVLKNWLLTSGKDELMEKRAVSHELTELEERIDTLFAELERRKPTMLLHAERVQHLQSVYRTSGGFSAETETSDSACLM